MQEALESLFGPGVGLIGFFVMLIIMAPKIRNYWRGFRSRQKGPADCRTRITGQRVLPLAPNISAQNLPKHPEHGEPVDLMTANIPIVLVETLIWLSPLILTLCCIPQGYYSLKTLCLVVSTIIALFGVLQFLHLFDRVAFYKTGAVIRTALKKRSIDYNAILSYTERNALIPWRPSAFILHLDDNQLLVIEGANLKNGRHLKDIFRALPARIAHNAATEKLIHS